MRSLTIILSVCFAIFLASCEKNEDLFLPQQGVLSADGFSDKDNNDSNNEVNGDNSDDSGKDSEGIKNGGDSEDEDDQEDKPNN